MARLGVIADDITGANDTAVQFAKQNISSYVNIDFRIQEINSETADVIVVDTDSRDIAADAAYHKVKTVCEALKNSGITNIYKKVDSTLRGNLGAEIEATAAVFQSELVVIAPAFPINNRTTVGGYHLLNKVPIELTEIAYSPKSPVTESRIVELLEQQTAEKIGLITLNIIMKGTEAVKTAIQQSLASGEKWIVFDAVLDEHLALIVTAASEYQKVLWVGSAGLAEQLTGLYEWSNQAKPKVTKVTGAVLVVAGSVSKITQQQIKRAINLPNIQLIKLSVPNLLSKKEEEIAYCIQQAKVLLASGKDILLASSTSDKDVLEAIAAGESCGVSSTEVSEQTAAALGEVVAGLTECQIAGMVLTGGDTAIHVCRELGASAIEILREVAAGIPLGRLSGGSMSGLQVVTKAGAFGSEEALVLSIQAIKGDKE